VPPTRRRLVFAALVVAGLAILAGVAFLYFENRSASDELLILYGNIDIREAELAFNSEGKVETMLVEEGDTVRKGQLLATLDAKRYEAEVATARARVAEQQAVCDRLAAGSRPQEIREAREAVKAIEADLKDARATLRRTEKLARDGFASRQKLDDDRARVHGLEAQLKGAQQTLSLVVQGPRVEDIAAARAALRAREADLALALERLKDTKLYALANGTMKTRIVEPGAVVLAHNPVYTIALSDPVWVRTYVSEPDLGRIYPGMKAEVVTDTAPGKPHQGWVGFISPVAEFTPKSVETREVRTSLVYRLRVYVKNPDRSLRQGMPVTVRLKPDAGGGAPRKSAENGNESETRPPNE
jgi:HlyD family secretion protein